ncbi:hypothetical protein PFISCL1PPCAC_13258 [Pristionchus fissidentatus]|uniref:Tyrosine phosphatase n=1 Tax=Pristionchus fissidentatus TaxID=1538716 RepID=A0AAV5VQU2_9BILA|nr:hypothetical protein PFISCL1PPCAC_13258 [Pristionchus fissidentatus]
MPPKPRVKKSTHTQKKEKVEAEADDDGTQVDTSAKRKKKTPSSGGATKRKRSGNSQVVQDPEYKAAFKQFVLNSVKVGVQGLLAEFDEIKKQTQAIGATPKVAFDTNPDKNRYKDVFCVDESRVTLQGGEKDYIHANWVDVADKRRYVCTQGPIVATIDDFWRMVWQEKCKSIVMLCNIVECGKKKCEQYWPESGEFEAKYGELSVKVTGKNEFEKLMTVTNLTVSDGAESHELEHILWNNWPDRGVPADTLTCFKLLDKLKTLSPTVIHCSAGIGRTGTIVGLDLILTLLKQGSVKKGKDIVIELRARRHGSVQMDIQYLYIHRVLIALGVVRRVVTGAEVKSFVDAYEALCKQRGFL